MNTNSLVTKIFETTPIRFILDDNNTPWFVGKDIALALDYVNTAQAIRGNCRDPKSLKDIGVLSVASVQNQGLASNPADLDPQTKMIKRADVSRLIARAKVTDKTEKFETWLFDDVLESIYDNGSYNVNPNNLPVNIGNILQTLADQNKDLLDKFNKLDTQYTILLEAVKPVVKLTGHHESVIRSSIDVAEFALRQNMTTREMYSYLRRLNLIQATNYNPTQKALKDDVITITSVPIRYNNGDVGKSTKSTIYVDSLDRIEAMINILKADDNIPKLTLISNN